MAGYLPLTEATSIKYIKEIKKIFPDNSKLASCEIGDGNLNMVFKITDIISGKSVVLKQALPHLRVVGKDWPLTLDRSRIEVEAMKAQYDICPEYVPRIYHTDTDMALSINEDLSYLGIMRFELMKMKRFPDFPRQIGEFLARTIFYTSDLFMNSQIKKELVIKFSNPQLCKISEDLIFTDPFYDSSTNKINPEIRPDVYDIWRNDELLLKVVKLKEIFLTKAQSLIHGDLHTGSVFISMNEMKVFDSEFSFFGPAAFDIGAIIANLLLNYASWEGIDDYSVEEILDYREYILNMIEHIYDHINMSFAMIWERDIKDEYKMVKDYREHYITALLRESAGFSGCKIIRRVVGLAHVADIDSIQDTKKRAKAQRLALKIGTAVIIGMNEITDPHDLTDLIRRIKTRNE
jgi:5-methylthioribose kinase